MLVIPDQWWTKRTAVRPTISSQSHVAPFAPGLIPGLLGFKTLLPTLFYLGARTNMCCDSQFCSSVKKDTQPL